MTRRWRRWTIAALGALGAASVAAGAQPVQPAQPTPPAQPLLLHVPSPDWRDQVIYFVLTDRFDDGDPSNNDQGAGEYNPASNAHYNGGDFAGLQRRLDYIRGLGATALWITPPVANQWWDGSYSGYHGYWAQHFQQVDRHLGTLDNYKALSHALHSRGMFLVQDIVLNHTGNFFRYDSTWRAGDPARGWQPNAASRPVPAPTQSPFDLNDPRNPAHRAAGIYHWTPDIVDYKQPQQLMQRQMSGLDDLNTDNPRVRQALRDSHGFWVREVGVDAFRVDTVFYVPPSLFQDFLRADDPAAPGIEQVARATGRHGFYTFGEGFDIDPPFATTGARRIETYVRADGQRNGRLLMPGMLNFSLYGSLGDVLARGAPTAVLGHRIQALMRLQSDPHRMANFVDNHDVDRFLAGGSEAGLRQALLAIMTLPGVPVLYYGTEQGFTAQRGAMFAAGFASGGRDRFDTAHPLYQTIARLTALRKSHPLFSRGTPTVLQTNRSGPGVIAWRMQHGRDAALVVLNTADTPHLLHNLPTGLPAGVPLPSLLALDGEPATLRTGPGGRVTASLPPRSGQVWRLPTADATLTAATAAPQAPSVTQARPAQGGNRLQARGRAPAGSWLQLVLDGDLARATTVQADARGQWQATLDVSHLRAAEAHALVAWQPDAALASAPQPFRLQRAWTLVADQADPADDDHGPGSAAGASQRYTYPTDPSWAGDALMDLRRARVWRAGSALKIELTMAALSQVWRPANGFDHVVFTLFFSQPGRPDGLAVMPQQQASLPGGLRWQHRLRAGGWAQALYRADGAGAETEGSVQTPGATLAVDPARRTVTFTLPAGSLGPAEALAGLRLHITTWDFDGGYRALGAQAGGHSVGGADPAGPKVMDAMTVVLP